MFYSIWNLKNKFDSINHIESDSKFLIWDLIQKDGDFFLVKDNENIWKPIAWKFSYFWNLFEARTLKFQEFFQNYRFSWYFRVFNLYVKDFENLRKVRLPIIKRGKKINITWTYISKYKNYENYKDFLKMWDMNIKSIKYDYFLDFKPGKWQNLFVFPDLRSINSFTQKIDFKYHVYSSNSTNLSKLKDFVDIKTWKIKNVITTHSGVFQDRKNLQNIFIFDPYKWYYKNQQSPRYCMPDLAKQVSFFYNVPNLYFVMV